MSDNKPSDDVVKLGRTLDRIASASVGLCWQQSAGHAIASLMASNACSAVLVHMNIAGTNEVKTMVFTAVSTAMRQYYDAYMPREVPAFNPPFKFVKKGVEVP
jgi:hypothetical protein